MNDAPLDDPIVALRRILTPLGAPVFTQAPPDLPPAFVQLSVTGGTGDGTWIGRPHITAVCWDTTAQKAADLAGRARHLILDGARSDDLVHGAEATWPVSLPDPDTGRHRSVFTTQITII